MSYLYEIVRKTKLGAEVLIRLNSYKDVINNLCILNGTTDMLEQLYLKIKDVGEVKVSEIMLKNNKFIENYNDYKMSKEDILKKNKEIFNLRKNKHINNYPYLKDFSGSMDYVSIPCFCNSETNEIIAVTLMVDCFNDYEELFYTILYDDFSDNQNHGVLYNDIYSNPISDDDFVKHKLNEVFFNNLCKDIDKYYQKGSKRGNHPWISDINFDDYEE